MKYWFFDLIDSVKKEFDTKEAAEFALEQMKKAYLERESFRFPIGSVTVNGNDTTWGAVTDDSPEEGNYQVFNHKTGTYTQTYSLSTAKAMVQVLKQEFLDEMQFKVFESDIGPQPSTSGTQTL